jgi:hypothetical protein
MHTSTRLLGATAIAAFAVLGAASSYAQTQAQDDREANGSEAIGQTTSPRAMNSTVKSEDVKREAIAAAHASGSEPVGQSTSPPAMNSSMSSDEVYKGAVAASHPAGSEAEGQSTVMKMPKSGS